MAIVVLDNCTGCGSCVSVCRDSALSLETEFSGGYGRKRAVVDIGLCCNCEDCISVCPHVAIELCN